MDQFGVRKTINRNVYKAMLFLQSSKQRLLFEDEIANRVKKQMRGKKDCADMEIHQSLLNLTQLGIIICSDSSHYSVGHYLKPDGLNTAIKRGRVTKAKTRTLAKRGKRDVPIRIQNFPMATSAVMCNECMPVVRRFTISMGSLNLGGSPSDFVNVSFEENSNPEETQENP
ncbi:hypothetical protein KR215_010039 [Drosophila sulfurigaster]|nr:hypothetical protein KR215_010039 [Drosophila sulfurigaster]